MNAPIGKADRRRARLHPARSSRPALIVHTFSEYTHHIRGGAKRLIIDADPDLWFDLGHVPHGVDVKIIGQSCAGISGGSIAAAGRCFLQACHRARVTAYEFAHVEAFDGVTIEARGKSHIVGTDHAKIRAEDQAVVFAHSQCHVQAAGHTLVAATDTSSVSVNGDAHVRASAGVHIIGVPQPRNLSIESRPISRLANQLNM
ncbi:hypothetical protein ACH49M_30490 [Rhodococcus qingshengii]|uniref:Uncharacterized protein n=1 Tax=Rhodococcus baikonurensis TaxID=172041 RepID=A0ABV5XQA1_9NOCA|nr:MULTISPECIES: hypothetical protein [Rhodococcus]MBP1054692.1 hypothetical protein [Rhodococcus qingshengii]MBW0282479.1 hypothetical protein [Rhodococcus sp. FH8]